MDLKELLGEELYNQVMAKAGDKKLAIVSDGNWFPKEKFDEVNTAKKAAEEALSARDTQLEDLKKSKGDAEALQQQITQLQADNQAAKEKYEADTKDLQLSTALKLSLAGKVHDPDIVTGLIDKTKIELDENGNIKAGFEDQVKALQESKGFLFVPEDNSNQFHFKGFNPAEGGDKGNGGKSSVGASFAKSANEGGKPPAAANNPWG